MPRQDRNVPRGWVYHVLNRSVGPMKMLRHDGEFEAFERLLVAAHERHPRRILSFCMVPNHWQLFVDREEDRRVQL
jgi:putative transposase